MTKRTFTGKTGDVWEWEETPEVLDALRTLHNLQLKKPHDYEGPLYAPHPDIKKQDDKLNYDTSGK